MVCLIRCETPPHISLTPLVSLAAKLIPYHRGRNHLLVSSLSPQYDTWVLSTMHLTPSVSTIVDDNSILCLAVKFRIYSLCRPMFRLGAFGADLRKVQRCSKSRNGRPACSSVFMQIKNHSVLIKSLNFISNLIQQ